MKAAQGGIAEEVSDQPVFEPAWSVSAPPARPGPEPVTGSRAEAERPLAPHRAPTGGVVSFSSEWRERLAGGSEADPGLVEQFRRLAATLHHAHGTNGIRSVMVTSAVPGDGKTLTAVNLALVLAESYRYNVLLIDADLRRPSIPTVVDLGDGAGLSDALRAATEQKLVLAPITPRLTLLPAGHPISNSIEALTSPRMRQILDEAVTRFDWIVLDSPPVGPTADARLLAEMVDGALFVIHAGKTQWADVQSAVDAIGRDRILGVVLNGVAAQPGHEYYYAAPGSDPRK